MTTVQAEKIARRKLSYGATRPRAARASSAPPGTPSFEELRPYQVFNKGIRKPRTPKKSTGGR